MNDAFGDALMVEMGDLFAENEVLKQNGPALAILQRVLVVRNSHALVGGQHLTRRIHTHSVQRVYGGIVALHSLRTCFG